MSAALQFTSDEVVGRLAAHRERRRRRVDAPAFGGGSHDLSGRATTAASAAWNPGAWNHEDEAGPAQVTTDLTAVLQEIVGRPGWDAGNAAVLLVFGTGVRTADAYDGSASTAPSLVVRFTPRP